MTLDLDGMAVLRSIGENRKVFSSVEADAAKYARMLATKQLKAKGAGLPNVHAVREALGGKAFALLIDFMKDTEIKTLVGRIDKYHPDLKTSDAAWRREHFRALANGKAVPSEKPAKPTKTKKKPSKTKNEPTKRTAKPKRPRLGLKSMGANRESES